MAIDYRMTSDSTTWYTSNSISDNCVVTIPSDENFTISNCTFNPPILTRDEIIAIVHEEIDAYLKKPEIQEQIDELIPRMPIPCGRRDIQI